MASVANVLTEVADCLRVDGVVNGTMNRTLGAWHVKYSCK